MNKKYLLILLAISFTGCIEKSIEDKAMEIHETVITLDTHDDFSVSNFTDSLNYTMDTNTQFNLPKMQKGGLDVGFLIVYTGQKTLDKEGYQSAKENDIRKRKGRKEYKRGVLTVNKGNLFVKCLTSQGSNILSSLKNANCYIELDEVIDKVSKGTYVKTIPFVLESEHYD